MADDISDTSPRRIARLAGLFYLLTFVLSGVAGVAWSRLVVPADAGATAANIAAHQPTLWLGFAADLVVSACYIAVTALLYTLLRPVNRTISLLAALFSAMGCAVQACASLFHIAPVAVLGGAPYLTAFTTQQLQALALLFFKLYGQGYNLGVVFFALYCLLIGYLVFKSAFLPRTIGVLMMVAGLSWLTFLVPPLAIRLSPYNLIPGIIGEGSLTLWLLVRSINEQRWNATANRTAATTAPNAT